MYCLCYLFIIHFPFFSEITLVAPAATQTHFHSYIITTFFLVHFNCIAFSSPLSHTIYYIVLFTTLLCCFNEQGRFVLVLCCCCLVFLFTILHTKQFIFLNFFFYISQPIYVYCIQTRQTDIYTHDTLTDTNNLTFTLPLSNLQCKTQ